MRRYHAAIWEDGIAVASVSGSDPEAVRREVLHYAAVYAQDGPVQIKSRNYAALFGSRGATATTTPAPEPAP